MRTSREPFIGYFGLLTDLVESVAIISGHMEVILELMDFIYPRDSF